jgi:hypothetical protein|tara:strand:- start:6631 stop:8280 length:1650 start_codon:yes stop_codon:yes gene_type:complete
MTPTKIIYDGFDFGDQPTPFLSSQENFLKYGENFGSEELYSLNGQLTGRDFNELRSEQLKLISGFSKDFGTFIVKDFKPYEAEVMVRSGVKIDSIDFGQSKYNKIIDYNISFTAYPVDYFGDNYGVIDPAESWSFEEGNDGIVSISHLISARGIETPQADSYDKSSSLQNAIDYVKQRTGSTQTFISPHFICKDSDYSLNLDSLQENIDRVQGTYSVTENYSSDLYGNSGILRYSADIDSSIDAPNSIVMQGRLEGVLGDPISIIRDRFLTYDWFSTATEFLINQFGSASIGQKPLQKNITEDLFNNSIKFSYSFGDDESIQDQVRVDTDISINSGTSLVSVSVGGSVTSSADKSIRSGLIQSAFEEIDIFDIANGEFNAFFGGNAPKSLSNRVTADSFSRDSDTYAINFDQSFDNKDAPEEDFFKEVKTSLSFTPSKISIASSPLPGKGGEYDTIDLEIKNRAYLDISLDAILETGSSQSMDQLVSSLKDKSNDMLSEYGQLRSLNLEGVSIGTGDPLSITLNSRYSFESNNNLFTDTNYSLINDFRV